jgi:hypothetical protein
MRQKVTVNKKKANLKIWDISGNTSSKMLDTYLYKANAVLLN